MINKCFNTSPQVGLGVSHVQLVIKPFECMMRQSLISTVILHGCIKRDILGCFINMIESNGMINMDNIEATILHKFPEL